MNMDGAGNHINAGGNHVNAGGNHGNVVFVADEHLANQPQLSQNEYGDILANPGADIETDASKAEEHKGVSQNELTDAADISDAQVIWSESSSINDDEEVPVYKKKSDRERIDIFNSILNDNKDPESADTVATKKCHR